MNITRGANSGFATQLLGASALPSGRSLHWSTDRPNRTRRTNRTNRTGSSQRRENNKDEKQQGQTTQLCQQREPPQQQHQTHNKHFQRHKSDSILKQKPRRSRYRAKFSCCKSIAIRPLTLLLTLTSSPKTLLLNCSVGP